jgi:hypothetical protein
MMNDAGNGNGEGAEIDRLAGVAQDANIVDAVVERQGEFVEFFDRETAAYFAAAGAEASDEGLANHIKQRTAEMRGCWTADVDEILTGRDPACD